MSNNYEYKITGGLISGIFGYFGYNAYDCVDNLKFKHWKPDKLRMLFGNMLDFGELINSRTTSLYAAKSEDTIYICSPNIMTLGVETAGIFSHPIKHIDLDNLDLSGKTNIASLFVNNDELETVTFGNIDTSNIWNIQEMFRGCGNLRSIDFSGIDLHRVHKMERLFMGCKNLESVNLGNIPLGDMTLVNFAFKDCPKLTPDKLSSSSKSIRNRENLMKIWKRAMYDFE